MAVERETHSCLVELCEDWLSFKELSESDTQRRKGNSARARQGDLVRWGSVLSAAAGREVDDGQNAWEVLALSDLESAELVWSALALARQRWSAATVARMMATLRGFVRWLVRRGHITYDVVVGEEMAVAAQAPRTPKALDDEALAALLAAAVSPPPPRSRQWWPARDVAIVEMLAGAGLRASELVAVRDSWVRTLAERPVLAVEDAKGDKARDVPMSGRVVATLDTYLKERNVRFEEGPVDRPTFVRNDGRPIDVSVLDRLLRGLARRAHIEYPPGAAAHSLRHRWATDMALRGVPMSVMQQLLGHVSPETTARYTKVAARDLIAALDDADML